MASGLVAALGITPILRGSALQGRHHGNLTPLPTTIKNTSPKTQPIKKPLSAHATMSSRSLTSAPPARPDALEFYSRKTCRPTLGAGLCCYDDASSTALFYWSTEPSSRRTRHSWAQDQFHLRPTKE